MKIALLHAYDTRDRRSWSGTVYYIARTLEKYCGEVIRLGPIPRFKEMLTGKIINRSSQILFRKNFKYHYSFLLAKRYARVTAQMLAERSFDVIVAPAGTTETAFLETNIPIVLVEDSTYGLLLDYNFEFSNVLPRSIYEMQTIQTLALKKASVMIYSSAWAARSAIEDYGTDPAKVHVIPFGANLDGHPGRTDCVWLYASQRHCP